MFGKVQYEKKNKLKKVHLDLLLCELKITVQSQIIEESQKLLKPTFLQGQFVGLGVTRSFKNGIG